MKQVEIDLDLLIFSALNYIPFVLKVHYKDEAGKFGKEK